MASTGSIVFGAALSGTMVLGKGRVFYSPKTLAWVAHWNSSAKAAPTTIIVTRLNGPGPHPLVVWSRTAAVRAGAMTTAMLLTSGQMKAHKIQDGGQFQIKYSSGSTVLATGTVSLSSGSTSNPGGGPY